MDQICNGAKIKAAQLSVNKDDCGDTVNTNSTGEKVRRTYVCNKISIHIFYLLDQQASNHAVIIGKGDLDALTSEMIAPH